MNATMNRYCELMKSASNLQLDLLIIFATFCLASFHFKCDDLNLNTFIDILKNKNLRIIAPPSITNWMIFTIDDQPQSILY